MKSISLSKEIKKVHNIIIVLLVAFVAIGTISNFLITNQYDRIMRNVIHANNINKISSEEIYSEMWKVVAGLKNFHTARQYVYIGQMLDEMEYLEKNAISLEGKTQLKVAVRTTNTLKSYIDLLGEQIENKEKVDVNMETLKEIKNVSLVLSDVIEKYSISEIDSASELNVVVKRIQKVILFIQIVFALIAIRLLLNSQKNLVETVSNPFKKMSYMTKKISKGELDARIGEINVEEMVELKDSLNYMAERIEKLIEQNKQEQENLKKAEVKLLQVQIAPHFLYNTYDTIIWLAETNKNEEIIEVVTALSIFYRVALSKGADWIRVEREIDYIKSYLIIQQYRYSDILDYSIDIEDEIKNKHILKLTLQPLVENAIYHGIKYLRSKGYVKISGYLDKDYVCFSIKDNGVGIDKEKLEQIRGNLTKDKSLNSFEEKGFGLHNVYRRLSLYYKEGFLFQINSTKNKGTEITIKLKQVENV